MIGKATLDDLQRRRSSSKPLYQINMDAFSSSILFIEGSLVELVEQQPASRCVVGSIPADSALEV
jgi:hypothetical protein